MRDNKTSQKAMNYDKNVHKTHELYPLFLKETLKLIKAINENPQKWLDTGGGTGELINQAKHLFPNTDFILVDPSEAMLSVAQDKFKENGELAIEYIQKGTEELDFKAPTFDVITAILSHHYFNENMRKKATMKCFDILKKEGVYITFETMKPETERGIKIGLDRWYKDQRENGKTEEEAQKHIRRYGKELFPITINEQINLLKQIGFSTVEVFWISGMQAGFYAIK